MTGLGYTLPAAIAVIVVCVLELAVFRTGLFLQGRILDIDGHRAGFSGHRRRLADQAVRPDRDLQRAAQHRCAFPFDIPVEDFLFGFALVTAVLMLWERQR